jgi:hypothetical protein
MKISKQKFNDCVDYFKMINDSKLEELDLSEFNIALTKDNISILHNTGLNNVLIIKMLL